ncbi:MAG: tetratricopeptide repeat protein [Phycisphaerales bacterium]|nr:tetratricopeptide repeat protein [Phycisphaerales bacterium]
MDHPSANPGSIHDQPTQAGHSADPAPSHPGRRELGEPPAAPTAPNLDPGASRIGPYRLIRALGEGGFGVVYLAEQASPQRRVAVKVLRPGIASPQALSRFALEAQTLGRLQHPGIAQVFEAGFYDPVTGRTVEGSASAIPAGGQPYFAMEYVEGVPLNTFIKDHAPNRRARLELVIQICEAVQHAHAKGVIHRDLKPANILIDRSGRAKVLDFGVARITGEQAQRTLQTDVGQLVGTLGYMSPEQIAADPSAIDTRSDVYALGAILYEVLSGRAPHHIQGKMLHEATRVICEEPPSRLATIDRTLRGDLDTIVAKALEKDRARRYQSASDLAADLRRYLLDQPIVARPPGTWYQLRKFARRNKALVGGVVASFLLLAAGAVGTSYWAIRATAAERDQAARRAEAEDARKEAVIQRDTARREAEKARAVIGFLESTLAAADPDKKGRDVRLADMLDSAVTGIDADLNDQPEVSAALRKAIAGAYKGLGQFDAAAELASRAAQDLSRVLGPDHPDTLDAREVLAQIRVNQSRHAEAVEELAKIHEARVRSTGREDIASIDTISNLAAAYSNQGDLDAAEREARRATEGFTSLVGPEAAETMSAKLQLAQILAAAEKTGDAERMIAEVLEVRLRTLQPSDQRIQNARDALGNLYRMQGKYSEAAEVYRQTLESHKSRYGPEHATTLSKATDLGKALQQAGRLDEAEAILRPTLEASIRVNGSRHFDTLTVMGFLSETLQLTGSLEEAESLRRSLAEGRAATLGPDHPQTLIAYTNLAYILTDLKRFDEADGVLADLLKARERLYGPDHAEVAVTLSLMGFNLLKAGQPARAEPPLRRSLAIREKLLPEGSGIRGITMSSLGESLLLQDRPDEARPLITTGAEWVLADPRAPARNKREVVDRAVRLYDKLGRADDAAAWQARAPQAGR